jgi:hypothetical protein
MGGLSFESTDLDFARTTFAMRALERCMIGTSAISNFRATASCTSCLGSDNSCFNMSAADLA